MCSFQACAYNGTDYPDGEDFVCENEEPELECWPCFCHCTDGVIDEDRVCPLSLADCPTDPDPPPESGTLIVARPSSGGRE